MKSETDPKFELAKAISISTGKKNNNRPSRQNIFIAKE
jgi:hypothetical protein